MKAKQESHACCASFPSILSLCFLAANIRVPKANSSVVKRNENTATFFFCQRGRRRVFFLAQGEKFKTKFSSLRTIFQRSFFLTFHWATLSLALSFSLCRHNDRSWVFLEVANIPDQSQQQAAGVCVSPSLVDVWNKDNSLSWHFWINITDKSQDCRLWEEKNGFFTPFLLHSHPPDISGLIWFWCLKEMTWESSLHAYRHRVLCFWWWFPSLPLLHRKLCEFSDKNSMIFTISHFLMTQEDVMLMWLKGVVCGVSIQWTSLGECNSKAILNHNKTSLARQHNLTTELPLSLTTHSISIWIQTSASTPY